MNNGTTQGGSMSETGLSERYVVELFEWDWGMSPAGKVLHSVGLDNADPELWGAWPGVSVCGVRSEWMVPGIFSRLGASRCSRCCRALNIAAGIGSPKNDEALRPWVSARLKALNPRS